MKKIYGLAALSAAMMLASCSNENEPNVVPTTNQKAYMSVRLAAAEDTRAEAADSYLNGTTDASEYEVKDVVLLAFDASGKCIGQTDPITDFTWAPNTGGMDNVGTKVVEFEMNSAYGTDAEAGSNIVGVMAILNGSGTSYVNQMLDNIRVTSTALKTDNGFVMTNSAYGTGNYTTDCSNKVFADPEKALLPANTVDIYVERAAARVDINKAGDNFMTHTVGTGDDQITVTITGVGFINDMDKTNLVKNISDITTDPFTGWNTDSFRSHWAVNHASASAINVYYPGTKGQDNALKAYDKAASYYLHENAAAAEKDATHVVVTAELSIAGSVQDVYTLFYDGKNYTDQNAKTKLCTPIALEGYQYIKVSETDNKTITETRSVVYGDLTFVAGEHDYDAQVAIAKGTDGWVLIKGATIADAVTFSGDETTVTLTGDKYRAIAYKGGKSYYYVPIKPNGSTDLQKGVAGIIRNHVYNLTFTSISGLGVALFNPDHNLIIQEMDEPDPNGDNKWYLGARINVLPWKVYTQSVEFK